VVLGAGSKILGGIQIGNDVTVGANAVVVDSVEAGSTMVGIPARKVRTRELENSKVALAISNHQTQLQEK